MMTFQPLRSTAIAAAGYDPDTRTMEIEFVNGRTYTHFDVPLDLYDSLVNSPSPGQFYNARIKGVY